jgi:N6-adenosine-specific RNA methylase IME4
MEGTPAMTAYSNFDDVPRKHYGVIYADPAWKFKTYAPPKEGAKGRRDVERHYPTMTLEEIKALPVRRVAAKDCYLILWCTWPFLEHGLATLKAWGFTYSSSFKVWAKLREGFSPTRAFITNPDDFPIGTGYTTRKNSEFCLLGRRGSPRRLARDIPELIVAPVREHSRKPDLHAEIERYAAGPYLEMNARTAVPGWDQWGNEVEKFVRPPEPPKAEPLIAPVQPCMFQSRGGE